MSRQNLSSRFSRIVNFIEAKFSVGVGTKIFIPFFIVTFLIMGLTSYLAMTKITEKIGQMEQGRAALVLNSTFENFTEQVNYLEVFARLLADSPQLAGQRFPVHCRCHQA